MTKIIITVNGGSVDQVITTEECEFKIVDFDNIKAGDPFPDDWEEAAVLRESLLNAVLEELKKAENNE